MLSAAALVASACGGEGDGGAAEPTTTGAPALHGMIRTPPLDVGGVELPDESPGSDGAPFAMRAEPDGLLLVYFGYTSCPDICPTTLADIGAALREMTSGRDSVAVAMVTFDPERDTGEVISSYLEHFVDGGHALRPADARQQEAAEEAFHVVADRVEGAREEARYDFEHTAITYVVDDRGTVVLEWPFGTAPEDMRSDMETLLAGAAPEGDTDKEESG